MTSGGRQGMLGLLGLLGFIYRISLSGILTKGVMDGSGMLWMVVRMLVDGYRCYRFWLSTHVHIYFSEKPHGDILWHILVDQILLSRKLSLQNLSLQPDAKTHENYHNFTWCLLHFHDSYDELAKDMNPHSRTESDWKSGTRNHCTKGRAASACVCSGGLIYFASRSIGCSSLLHSHLQNCRFSGWYQFAFQFFLQNKCLLFISQKAMEFCCDILRKLRWWEPVHCSWLPLWVFRALSRSSSFAKWLGSPTASDKTKDIVVGRWQNVRVWWKTAKHAKIRIRCLDVFSRVFMDSSFDDLLVLLLWLGLCRCGRILETLGILPGHAQAPTDTRNIFQANPNSRSDPRIAIVCIAWSLQSCRAPKSRSSSQIYQVNIAY